jgi:hypothetical protein
MYVQRAEGKRERLWVTPTQSDDMGGMLGIGIAGPVELRGLEAKDAKAMEDLNGPDSMLPKQMLLVMPGDVVTAVNGEAVG